MLETYWLLGLEGDPMVDKMLEDEELKMDAMYD